MKIVGHRRPPASGRGGRRKASACVLISGGVDSDVLLAEALSSYRKVYPVFIRQGLAWEAVELYWLRRFLGRIRRPGLEALQVLSLPMADVYGAHWSTGHGKVPGARTKDEAVFLPGRNLVLALKAAVFAILHQVPLLLLGSLGHNPFPDATPRFFRHWSSVLSEGLGRRVRVQAPYRTLSKTQVIRRGKTLPLSLSFSCIAPRGRRHCGRCNKCAERRKAFRMAGVKDFTDYAAA